MADGRRSGIDPGVLEILEAMRRDREASQQLQQQQIQAQQQQMQLQQQQKQALQDLVTRLALPPRDQGNRVNEPHNADTGPVGEEGHRVNQPVRERSWDGGLRVEIPDFTGSLKPEEYLDWTNTVEEVFELKEVPLEKRVPLVTIRFRERAATWWQNFKYMHYHDNLPPLND